MSKNKRQLRSLAKKHNITLDYNPGDCYEAIAPVGYCFEPGLHLLVASFDGQTQADARVDLMDRIICGIIDGKLERCDCNDCEYIRQ